MKQIQCAYPADIRLVKKNGEIFLEKQCLATYEREHKDYGKVKSYRFEWISCEEKIIK